ncbi:MAG: HDOD domain-containing protein [Ilumatobacteraceae bacterium]
MAVLTEHSRLMVHPASAGVVLGILRNGDDRNDLTRVVMADPALSVAVLRAANSAHLGYSGRVGGVRQATVMLGGSLVGSLAASRVADLVFDTTAREYPEWYWLHSVAVACGASVVARHLGESSDEAFTAGILHDIGWLLAASNVEPGASLSRVATAVEHSDAGADLLRRWNLPDRVVAAVRMHHTKATLLTPPMTRAVVAGHAIAEALGATGPERSISMIEAMDLAELGSTKHAVLLAEVEAEIESVTSALRTDR